MNGYSDVRVLCPKTGKLIKTISKKDFKVHDVNWKTAGHKDLFLNSTGSGNNTEADEIDYIIKHSVKTGQ